MYKQAVLGGVWWQRGWGPSVFLQAPEHGGRHALLLQPHLWGGGREDVLDLREGRPRAPRPASPADPLPLGSRSISSSSSSSPSSISSGLACCASSASSSREASLLVGRALSGAGHPSNPYS